MANKTYWLGEKVGSRRAGQLKVDGKLYGIGDPFPAGKVDKDTMKRLKESGCVGTAPFDVPDPAIDDAKDKDILMLQGKLSDAAVKATEDGDRIAELEIEIEAAGGDGDSAKEIAELNKLIDDLKDGDIEEITNLKADVEEKAALIEKQKTEIKALKKEVKK